jgi:hypothetical protein
MRTVNLTPEGLGVLRALARLGLVHRYDAVGLELVRTGLAEVKGERLVITTAGYAAAAALQHRRPSARRVSPQSAAGAGRPTHERPPTGA